MDAGSNHGGRRSEVGGRRPEGSTIPRGRPSRQPEPSMPDALLHDLRLAWRAMCRAPGFTAIALVMIALGTGANAAMFSVIDTVMLRSPFRDPDRLAIVLVAQPGREPSAAV